MNLINKLREQKIIIVTHEYATGPSHSLEEYLHTKCKNLLFIGHPFVFAKDIRSHFRYYDRKGKLLEENYFIKFSKNELLSTLKDIITTLFLSIQKGKIDIYIGVDNINACVGVVLKKIGLVRQVIFYTIDYVPNRFNNEYLNKIYHFLDRFAVSNSDKVWNLSSIMTIEREKRGVGKQFRNKQIVVPVGTESDTKPIPFNKINRFHVAHMGHLTVKQGVQSIISAIPKIILKVPEFHLDIIGGGENEDFLKNLAEKLKVTQYIAFYGFIKSHKEVEEKLSYCAMGVAPYVDNENNFVRYTDPGKVKAYLAAGLPVVITKVPEVWKELVNKKCGLAIRDDVNELANAVVKLLSNVNLLNEYRKNAKKEAKKFTWEKIFSQALNATL